MHIDHQPVAETSTLTDEDKATLMPTAMIKLARRCIDTEASAAVVIMIGCPQSPIDRTIRAVASALRAASAAALDIIMEHLTHCPDEPSRSATQTPRPPGSTPPATVTQRRPPAQHLGRAA